MGSNSQWQERGQACAKASSLRKILRGIVGAGSMRLIDVNQQLLAVYLEGPDRSAYEHFSGVDRVLVLLAVLLAGIVVGWSLKRRK